MGLDSPGGDHPSSNNRAWFTVRGIRDLVKLYGNLLIIAFNVGIAELVDISKMQFTVDRFLIAAILTWLLMALMIIVGIWYPAYKAMQLQPAEALHDE